MFLRFYKFFILFVLFIFICFMGLVFSFSDAEDIHVVEIDDLNSNHLNSNFIWPVPRYYTITSYFGYRKAPTAGAGTYHSGIDVAAPTGVEVVATFSGEVTYIGFYGANGYTIKVSDGVYTAYYSHLSPYFLVYVGQYVNKGDIIATVGPKNVYGVLNNPYRDLKGNPTNGATTGPHLHFSLYLNGKSVNPLDYLSY